jgi:aryl-alcohol dehydrogenase-like predicted oxidoreductase
MEVAPAAEHYGLGIIPWSPLHGGLLGGVLAKEKEGKRRREGRSKDALKKYRKQIKAYEDLCAELGEEPANVALSWLLHQPAVAAPIIGPRTMEQLEGSLRAVSLTLGDDVLDRLDEIFPGYKTSPEQYAW